MTSEVLTSLTDNGVATLTLNRSDHHNAFNESMIEQMLSALKLWSTDPLVRILVLNSTGKHFCAGADLNWMKRTAEYSEAANLEDAKQLSTLMHNLAHFPKPTLAIVQGSAFGGGVGLIACCHIAIVSDNARFCFSEAKLGLIPAVIAPYVIKAIGQRHALAYFLSSKPFTASDAMNMGLFHQIVPSSELVNATQQWIDHVLQGGPLALEHIVRYVQSLDLKPLNSDLIVQTAELIAKLRVSKEGQEGLSAFLDNRQPSWIK